jgi:hypothetical protein
LRAVKTLFVLALVVAGTAMAQARVWVVPYLCDEKTPLEAADPNRPGVYRDVMVGTRLVLFVKSDGPGVFGDHQLWSGALKMSCDDWQRGTLTGRGYNDQWHAYQGSCLPASGHLYNPGVWYREEPNAVGFNLSVGSRSVAGDWFVFDYHAQQAGTCRVGLYDIYVSLDEPIQTLSFTHVPTRDFNGDGIVSFPDFARLAAHWGSNADPNSPEAAFDFNADRRIDLGDLALFSAYWLEKTDGAKAATDPAQPSSGL